MRFFSREDLQDLRKWANIEYDKTNTDHLKAKEQLVNGVWSKTKKWCEDVAKEIGLSTDSKMMWLKQAGPGKFTFRSYSWGRLLDKHAWTDEVYFNVGVKGIDDQHLWIQFNYRNEAPKYLNEEQLKYCENLLYDQSGDLKFSRKIYPSEFAEYSWDRLIQETVHFIEEHQSKYNNLIAELEKLHSTYFTRICWNTNHWEKPSGSEGKSKSPQSFEGIYGFGLDEWLFSEKLFIDGYQYGFIQGVNKADLGEKFINLDLYTFERKNDGNICYWVASIKNVEVLDDNQVEDILSKTGFKKTVRSYSDSFNGKGDPKIKINSFDEGELINVRFKDQNVSFIGDEDLYQIEFETSKFPRYSLYKGRISSRTDVKSDILEEEDFLKLSGQTKRNRAKKRASEGERTPGSYQIYRRHDDISEALEQYLNSIKIPEGKVTPEAGLGSKAIDMLYEKPDELIYYEIKTHRKLVYSIREGIGQLLEYALWRRHEHQKNFKLVLVTHHIPTQAVRNYFKKLQDKYQLPIHYQQFDMKKNVLGELI